MVGVDQIPMFTLVGEEKIVVQVDYTVCDVCGFRLRRVETTLIGGQQIAVSRCPICQQIESEESKKIKNSEYTEFRIECFYAWLATHGLTRDTLECFYHLEVNHFFDDVN